MTGNETPTGVLLINFGEPETASLQEVTAFLERIFLANARVEPASTREETIRRSRELAARRAPGLVAEYERIDGSPLIRQAVAQGERLAAELRRRGLRCLVETAMQFTTPDIPTALGRYRAAGVERVVVLPVYPFCGPSTTVASFEQVRTGLEQMEWTPEVAEVSGWHPHPGYVRLRANAIERAASAAGVDLCSSSTALVFSAHGTPMRYVEAGSRYVEYVEDWCRRIASEVGVDRYTLGYQNHSNRGVEWTPPGIEDALGKLSGREAVVVDAVSFMHEQSETLVDLDIDLRAAATSAGLDFCRVPVPHDDPAFAIVLADLVELALERPAGPIAAGTCRCRPQATVCLNAGIGAVL